GLAPLGDIAITGPAAMPIHVKPLLDKLGIQADFLHVGAYKGAADPLTRDAPSRESQETLGAILDRRYQTMVDIIAAERKLDAAAVKALIDTALFPAEQARAAKLVDDVVPWEEFRDSTKAAWTKLELEPDNKDQLQTMMKLARFLGAMPADRPLGDHVAIVYAVGDIKDGDGDGVIGARQEITSHTLVAAIRALTADTAVKAVVLRIDSGGGSAQASELIWTAVSQLQAQKPVIVSMSDVAASGGYYIASGAQKIFAEEDTLTGSIGVIGGHIAPAAALAKLGVNTFPMGRGKHATLMSSFKPWTEDEKAIMRAHMEAVYTTFVARVAAGRKKTPEQIQPIAQGRVWTGAKAKELGLVDEIGGLDAAIAEARKLAKLDDTTALEVYPPPPTLRDVLAGWGQVHAPFGLHASVLAELALLDPDVAATAERLVKLVDSFRTTPLQTVAILPVLR
ncbi:MAG TPA: signal peptide peptidase SppA, partial [Kofleriaceae bacterium]|nr:signal peptide peptidase SppA [Kofleriaceae bacterium]